MGMGVCSQKEAAELSKLLNEIPGQKAAAIAKRKQIQVQLSLLMQSVTQVQDGLKDLILKNESKLADLMAHKVNLLDLISSNAEEAGGQASKQQTISSIRDSVTTLARDIQRSLADGSSLAEEFEMQKRIRIFLHLRSPENQPLPTFSLFEDGFYSNWATTENLSSTDRNLMVLSHLVFTILKRWNIKLRIKTTPVRMNFFSSLPDFKYNNTGHSTSTMGK